MVEVGFFGPKLLQDGRGRITTTTTIQAGIFRDSYSSDPSEQFGDRQIPRKVQTRCHTAPHFGGGGGLLRLFQPTDAETW